MGRTCSWRFFFANNNNDNNNVVHISSGKDFDVLVGGHLSRLGNKTDVQRAVDFFADVVAGAEESVAVVTIPGTIVGTGIADPANPNFGNTW